MEPNMKHYELTPPAYADIFPTELGTEVCAPGHRFGPYIRKYYLIHTVVSGRGTYTVEGKTYHLTAGDSFIIPPEVPTVYQADETDPWEYIWIGFNAGIVLPPQFTQHVWHDPQVTALFNRALQDCQPRQGREARLCSFLWQLVAMMEAKNRCDEPKNSQYVRRAKAIMRSQFVYGIQVADVAERIGLERSYFSNLFKKETGISPQTYLINIRMRRAAVLLKNRNVTPGIVALSVGYPDVFSFSRMFRRYYGASPSEYKKNEAEPKTSNM